MRLPIRKDTYAGQVIDTGKPLQAQRQPGEDQIKVKTHYLVESLLYVITSYSIHYTKLYDGYGIGQGV